MENEKPKKIDVRACGSRLQYEHDPRPEYRAKKVKVAFHIYDEETDSLDLYGYEVYNIKKNPIKELKNARLTQFFRELEASYINTASLTQKRTFPLPMTLEQLIDPPAMASPSVGPIFVPSSNRKVFHQEVNSANFGLWANGVAGPMMFIFRRAKENEAERNKLLTNKNGRESEDTTHQSDNVVQIKKATPWG